MNDLPKDQNHVTIFINDTEYKVSKSNNLLAGVLSQNLNLPYFCWHPSMGSVGACRQCAVTQYQDEHDTRGRLVMACTTPVTEGMRIKLDDESSTVFREQVIGAMMTNHPHDCPVCAEGGECHLQDMTVMTGHTSRQYQGDKRTFTNQYLGDLVGHEMNRCITCYRCVRFYKDYAGGEDFGVFGSKNQVYFGRQQAGKLESEFSGNLVEVCPTGVFTNKSFSAHYTRKWDLQSAPSVCAHCSIGCNTSIGERYGTVRRTVNRYNHDINGYFLCDRGRFGIGFVNGPKRIRNTKGIKQRSPQSLSKLDVATSLVHFKGKSFIGIGSARASLEANFYLKQIVGKECFSVGNNERALRSAATHQQLLSQYSAPSLTAIEQSDFVFIIDQDITQSSPRMALSVRQALRTASIEKAEKIGIPSWQDSAVRAVGGTLKTPLYSLTTSPTKLDKEAKQSLVLTPTEITQLLRQITQQITANSENICAEPQPSILSSRSNSAFSHSFIEQLIKAKKPSFIVGSDNESHDILLAVNDLLSVLKSTKVDGDSFAKVQLAVLPKDCNSVGLLSLIDDHTLSLEQIIEKTQHSHIDGVIVLENELSQLSPSQRLSIRENANTIIVLDHTETIISPIADVTLPVSPISEGDGHFVNYQQRIQRFYSAHPAVRPIQDSWRWLALLDGAIHGKASELSHIDSLDSLYLYFESFNEGWPITSNQQSVDEKGIARQTIRASGRTAQMANISVHEAKTTQSHDSAMVYSMEGRAPQSTSSMPFTWAPGWNSNQSINQYQQEIGQNLAANTPHLLLNISVQRTVHNTQTPNKTNGENLHYQIKPNWYRQEWQSALNPEFRLMHRDNTLVISSAFAENNQMCNGQVLVVKFIDSTSEPSAELSAENNEYTVVAAIDATLPEHIVCGDIAQLPSHVITPTVEVRAATQNEFDVYQSNLNFFHQHAQSEKKDTLMRLKANDQHIPIRMMNGGLDDA